ncbi:hypothetical protein RclHR1_18750003 [Rhizophagus clarus]|uniref:Uncharacterized protein n=1 Tax=Rhizophagus clarus TaxID=94130 RepID=A0A2Z6R3B9_9GLOM|nr:hypothetical protein RclHR1_18750003 [Rhizophagus clarus]GES88025.1 hypothetical protein RCL_jg2600.t1 [Rhizophagus clarus]
MKQDHILEQINNLFVQLGVTEEDNRSDLNDMSDNASQSTYEYSDDTHIRRTVYNEGEIIFNEENIDITELPSLNSNNQTTLTHFSLLQRTAQSFGFGNN